MKTLRGWVNLLVSQKVLGEDWLQKNYLLFTHWCGLQQRVISEACKVSNIRSIFSISNHGCYKKIKTPKMWWRNRAGKICAAGWVATWRCLVDLITHAADSRSGWHYPGTWHPGLHECQNVFLSPRRLWPFHRLERKWQPLATKVHLHFFLVAYQSFACFAIDRYAHPNKVPWVMRELQLRFGKIKFFCPLKDEGKVIGPPALCPPPTHPLLSCLIQVLHISIDLRNRRR